MSDLVITGILKLAFGFVSDRLRTYAAEKLQDGGLADKKFRGYVVRELDDIKFKLDANARKDLSTSISCLKQGVQRLTMSFGETGSPLTGLPVNVNMTQTTLNDATCGETKSKSAEPSQSTFENAVALANAIGKMKIESSERFRLAEESFKEAGREARRAFHNAALGTEERLLASKVRLASSILEHLDDPDLAAADCLQSLEELHAMPSMQEIFSVYVKGGIKSVFKKESRAEIVESVTMINLILANFVSKFTKRRMAVFDWPMIQCGKTVVHPIHYDKKRLPNLRGMEITPPWETVKIDDNRTWKVCALNKNGGLICGSYSLHGRYVLVDKRTCKKQPSCSYSSLVPGYILIDEDDAMYDIRFDREVGFTLLVYSAGDKSTRRCTLEFLEELRKDWHIIHTRMAVTGEKNLVIGCFSVQNYATIYLCDNNGKLIHRFDSGLKDFFVEQIFVTANGEIAVTTGKFSYITFKWSQMLHIFSQDGQLQRSVKFRPSNGIEAYDQLFYNQVTQKIVGYARLDGDILSIEHLSGNTAELERSYLLHLSTNFPMDVFRPLFHANGALALVSYLDEVIFLQNPSA